LEREEASLEINEATNGELTNRQVLQCILIDLEDLIQPRGRYHKAWEAFALLQMGFILCPKTHSSGREGKAIDKPGITPTLELVSQG
jgi:hypothetical protein